MGEHNSPTYRQGRLDGEIDSERVRNGIAPAGPQPPFPKYPWMYLRGYNQTYIPAPYVKESA